MEQERRRKGFPDCSQLFYPVVHVPGSCMNVRVAVFSCLNTFTAEKLMYNFTVCTSYPRKTQTEKGSFCAAVASLKLSGRFCRLFQSYLRRF